MYVFSQSASDSSVELERLRQLARTAQIINSRLSLEQVLNEVIDTVVALTGAERGFIVLQDQTSGHFAISVARKINQSDLESEAMRVSRTILEQVIQSGESILTTNAQDDPRFADVESVVDLRLRSLL
ncbi:MAG: hypothetical protein CUN49_17305, partial [Candidatus Thermofonsia Clade 1 bacterium]